MNQDSELYDKIQKLYEEYWAISLTHHKDSDYYPIMEELEKILYTAPDNEYALQLKIIIKRSYKRLRKEELKALCNHMHRINPNNKLAKVSRFKPSELGWHSQPISAAGLILTIVVFILIALQFISLFLMYTN